MHGVVSKTKDDTVRQVELFFGGKNCVRVTVPVVTQAHIEEAARVFRDLADEMDEIAVTKERLVTKVLSSRWAIRNASLKLKGGIAYKGAR